MDMTIVGLGHPKGRTRTQIKAKKDRAEAKVKKSVRSECVGRDGQCRFSHAQFWLPRWEPDTVLTEKSYCYGPSEWAHMHQKRRSQTRNQAPEVRHTTADSLMLCRTHHDQYDGRAIPRLRITCLTRNGADGPLKFTRAR